MAVADVHGAPEVQDGTSTVDTRHLPMGWAATKMVASFAAILFSIATFLLGSGAGKLATAAIATVFAVFSLMRPAHPKVRRKILSWVAIVFTSAAIVVAVYTALGLTGGKSPQVAP